MEVTSLVTELSELAPKPVELPESPLAGLPPLLTLAELCRWTGYSLTHVNSCRRRAHDPLPTLGTEKAPRFLPDDVLAWMRREYSKSLKSA